MKSFPKELMLDHDNIWFLDKEKTNIKQITFEYNDFIPRSKFYKIEGNDNYIIKVYNEFIFFEEARIKRMLKKFYEVSDKIPNIDFPIAYYQENGKVKGLVIPYYDNSVSLRELLKSDNVEKFMTLYRHGSNIKENIFKLYLEILELFKEMFQEGLSYLDIHGGNFLLYHNQLKIIDFEPKYLKYNKSRINEYHILERYFQLISKINFCFKIENNLIYPQGKFEIMEKEIKKLIKK